MTRFWIVTVAILTVLLAYSFGHAGQRACGNRAKMVKHLKTKYKENPRAVGLTTGSKHMLEIYTSSKGTWTVIMTMHNGVSCIMAAGKSWQDRDMSQYLPKH